MLLLLRISINANLLRPFSLGGGCFQEPGTQQSWGDADGPSLFDVNLTALVLVGCFVVATVSRGGAQP